MPPCRASLLQTSRKPNGTARKFGSSAGVRIVHQSRNASSAAALAKTAPSKQHGKVRTVLHKTESFLPRVLSVHADSSVPSSLKFWQEVLKSAYEGLNSSPAKKAARIAVYGCDECSGARELVTALLMEPFAPETQKQNIRDRWKAFEGQSRLTITYGFLPSDDAESIHMPSTWLQQFAVPVEVQEFSPASQGFTPTNTLFAADIPIIVYNPVTIPLSELLDDPSLPLSHPNAILAVVTSTNFPPGTYKRITEKLPKTLATVFVEPSLALSAVRTLSMDASSSLAVQRYQDDYTASRITDLTTIIADKLAETSQGSMVTLNEATAREQIKASLTASHQVLDSAKDEVRTLKAELLNLRDEVAELQATIVPEVLGGNGNGSTAVAVTKAKKEVKVVLDDLTWWKCLWRVDDVGHIVRLAVEKAWCTDLERKLVFHSGRLASSQASLAKLTKSLLSRYSSASPFNSPVLENSLSQLQTSLTYPIRPNTLTAPIVQRRLQLSYPTNTLQAAAQRVAIGTGGTVMSGLGLAWAGWAEHLGVLGGVLGTGLELETAAGAGMLVTALGIRWMIGKWEKAKRAWWRDWDRVGQGLERDLNDTLARVVEQQVVLVPNKACNGLNEVADKRKEEIDSLKDELYVLENELNRS